MSQPRKGFQTNQCSCCFSPKPQAEYPFFVPAHFAVACFTAGTPLVVDLEGNSRPIDEIEVGDFVLARSEFDPDGPLELKRVEEKFVRTAVVMELVVHGQSIKTTAEHPFYVPAQGKFVAAGELQVGEQLVGHDGKLVQIESIGSTDEVTTVYNLRVADLHTYFVGGTIWGWDVWGHNALYGSRAATKSLLRDDDALYDEIGRQLGHTGHHLVPVSVAQQTGLKRFFQLAASEGWAMNGERNGMLVENVTRHVNHHPRYNGYVAQRIRNYIVDSGGVTNITGVKARQYLESLSDDMRRFIKNTTGDLNELFDK